MTITVSCPSCSTTFPVDPAKVPEGGVNARCSVCAAVFFVGKSVAEGAGARAGAEDAVGTSAPAAAGAGAATEVATGPSDTPEAATEGATEEPVEWDEPDPTAYEAAPIDEPWGEEEPETPARGGAEDVVAEEEAEEAPHGFEVAGTFDVAAPEETAPVDIGEAGPAGAEVGHAGTGAAEAEAEVGESEPEVAEVEAEVAESEPDIVDVESEGAPDVEEVHTEPLASHAGPSAPTAPPGEREAAAASEPEPAAGFRFGRRDPHEKARRLARVLVSDMIMYNPERHDRALDEGTVVADFEEEIEKSWAEYTEQVGQELAESTTYFRDALNEILAKGEELFDQQQWS